MIAGFLTLVVILGQAGADDRVLDLVRGLSDADEQVREESWNILGGLGPSEKEALILAMPRLDRDSASALAEFLACSPPDRLMEDMIAVSTMDPPDHIAVAVRRAVRANPNAAQRAILKQLKDEGDDAAKISLIGLLSVLKDPASARTLMPFLSDKNDLVAGAARKALVAVGRSHRETVLDQLAGGAIADEVRADLIAGDVETLIDGMITDDGSTGYYRGQFDALKDLGNPAAVVLLRMAADPDYPYRIEPRSGEGHYAIVRNLALRALGEVGGGEFKERLQQLADSNVVATFTSEETISLAHALYRRGTEKYYRDILKRLHAALYLARENSLVKERIEIDNMLAHMYSRIEEHEMAIEMLKDLIDATATAPVSDAIAEIRRTAHYNLACSYAMSNRRKEAIAALRDAFAAGYADGEWIAQDRDLDNIRKEKEFEQLMDKHFKKSAR